MRTKGAKDKKPRTKYAGKPIKKKKKGAVFNQYKSRRDRSDGRIKLWVWQVLPMSKDGLKNWNRKYRAKVHKTIYKPKRRIDVMPEEISNKEKIEQLFIDVIGFEGNFLLKMFSNARNKYQCKAITMAEVSIIDSNGELRATCIPFYKRRSLSRLWFFSSE